MRLLTLSVKTNRNCCGKPLNERGSVFMFYLSHKARRRITLLLDLIAVFASVEIAILLRFHSFVPTWQHRLYRTVLLFEILICLILYAYRSNENIFLYVEKHDPFENLTSVLRSSVIIFASLVVFLVATQNAQQLSRIVFAYNFLFYIILDYLLHMLFRRYYKKHCNREIVSTKILLLTCKDMAEGAFSRLKTTLNQESELEGMCLLDEDREKILQEIEKRNVTDVVIAVPAENIRELGIPDFVRTLERRGTGVYLCLSYDGDFIPSRAVSKIGDLQAVYFDGLRKKCDVLGIHYTVSNVDEAAIYIKNAVKELRGQYICFSNVHTTVMAHDHPDYLAIQNGSAYTFPDGSPIARQQKRLGYMSAERVSGPDFMNAMFRGTMDGKISHYFYGSTEETIDKLRKGLEKNYPGINIKGMYSPPFRDLTPEEDAQTVQMLNDSGADIIWIGLGAPKQEKWMAAHKDKVNALMIGVGAGFNFYAGTVKRAPKWVQKAGMEWLYRLLQDPKRLWKRYFVTNIKYIWYIISGIF